MPTRNSSASRAFIAFAFPVLLTPDSLWVTDFGHDRVLRFAR
ncbi:hypothetical protein [Ramlibacter henchirensis]|nr:hypothetical protein [Ramlibacter henchirensis]